MEQKSVGIFRSVRNIGFYIIVISLPFTLTIPQIGIVLTVLGWLGEGVFRKNWLIKWHAAFVPLIGYLLWNICSSLFSPRPLHSVLAVADNEWLLLGALMLYWCIESEDQLQRLVYVFLIASVIPMGYAIWQTFAGLDVYPGRPLAPIGGYFRAVGFHGFYLTFAAFAMIVLLFSATLALEARGNQRKWFAALVMLSLLALISTFARSIWLSFIAAISILGFSRSKKSGALASLAVVLIIVVSFVAVPSVRERALSIFDPGQNLGRLNLWKTTLAIVGSHPILGIGQDNFDFFFPLYRIEGWYDSTGHPHNDYLNVLVSSGIPGLLAFLAVWWTVLREGFRNLRRIGNPVMRALNQGATLGVISFMIGAFFQNYYGTFLNCMEWWFLTGVILTCGRLSGEAGGGVIEKP